MSHTLTSLIGIMHWSLPPYDEWTQFEGWSDTILDNTDLWMQFIVTDPEDILAAYNNLNHGNQSEEALVSDMRFHKLMLPRLREGAKQAMERRMHGYQRMYRFKGVKLVDSIIILRTMFPGKLGLSEAFNYACLINDVGIEETVDDNGIATGGRRAMISQRPDPDAPYFAFIGNDDDLFVLRRARSMGVRPINFIVESYDGG